MASDDDSQALDTHHAEKEWEEQKENFRICYIENNMTRKEAAEFMKQHHNFHATPRQWERKIKQWGFSKYTGRDERLAQISQAGKTVLDVSRPGRRPRSLVDGSGNLQPHEDRNLRRFARREVSRNRSRSRSTSYVEDRRPQFKQEFSPPSTDATLDADFDFNDIGADMRRTASSEGTRGPTPRAAREQSEPFHHGFFQNQQAGGYGPRDQPNVAASVQNQWSHGAHHGSPPFNVTAQNQYETFPNGPIPLHNSQGVGFQNATQTFAENAPNTTFAYPVQNPAGQPLPAGFNQFPMPTNDIGMHPGMMQGEFMTGQAMFNNPIAGPDPLDETRFENNPMITFDIVDMDSPGMGAASDPMLFSANPPLQEPIVEPTLNDPGPLSTDVLPLVEQYTRAVRAITLSTLAGSSQQSGLTNKLAADLEQPSMSPFFCSFVCSY
jgi:hypothetical protein